MTVGRMQKRNCIKDLMMRRVENKVLDIVEKERSIKKIDSLVDPIIRKYFEEYAVLNDYYGGFPEQPLDEDTIKSNKCALIENMMHKSFENATEKMLDETKDIKIVDENLTKGMEKLFFNISKLYDFYGFDFELGDPDNEEDDDDAQDNQQGSKEEDLP